jgi:hypothetical protein
MLPIIAKGARGDAVGCGTVLQAGSSTVQFPMLSLEFYIEKYSLVQKDGLNFVRLYFLNYT